MRSVSIRRSVGCFITPINSASSYSTRRSVVGAWHRYYDRGRRWKKIVVMLSVMLADEYEAYRLVVGG